MSKAQLKLPSSSSQRTIKRKRSRTTNDEACIDFSTVFNCNQCTQRFNNKMDFDLHLRMCPNEGESFSCSFCQRDFSTFQQKDEHESLHGGGEISRYDNQNGPATFITGYVNNTPSTTPQHQNSFKSLRSWIQRTNTNDNTLDDTRSLASINRVRVKSRKTITYQTTNDERGGSNFLAEDDSIKSYNDSNYNVDISSTGLGSLKVNKCWSERSTRKSAGDVNGAQSDDNSNDLINNQSSSSDSASLQMCRFCPEMFTNLLKLNKHERKHVFEMGYTPDADDTSVQKLVFFSCDKCPKIFNNRILLQEHRNESHKALTQKLTQVVVFSCDVCSETFGNSSLLKNHKIINHPVLPEQVILFSCEFCLKNYTDRDDLLSHKPSHGGNSEFNSGPKPNVVTEYDDQVNIMRSNGISMNSRQTSDQRNMGSNTPLSLTSGNNSNNSLGNIKENTVCTFCKKKCSSVNELSYHLRGYHNVDPALWMDSEMGSSEVPPLSTPEMVNDRSQTPRKISYDSSSSSIDPVCLPCKRCGSRSTYASKNIDGNCLKCSDRIKLEKAKISNHPSLVEMLLDRSDKNQEPGLTEEAGASMVEPIPTDNQDGRQSVISSTLSDADMNDNHEEDYGTNSISEETLTPVVIGMHASEIKAFNCSSCGQIFSSKDKSDEYELCSKCFSKDDENTSVGQITTKTIKMEEISDDLEPPVNDEITDTPYKCQVCFQAWVRKSDLIKHLPLHSQEADFECKYCLAKFSRESSWKNHQVRHVNQDSTLYCLHCEKNFLYKWEMRKHCRSFRKYRLKVKTGGPISGGKKKQVEREPADVTKSSVIRCNVCYDRLNVKSLDGTTSPVQAHAELHLDNANHFCKYCGVKFANKKRLLSHQSHHCLSNGRFKCLHCSKTFIHPINLIRHFRKINKPDTDGGAYVEMIPPRKRGPSTKSYDCPVCFRVFNHRRNHERHIEVHSGENSVKCEYCGADFKNRRTCTSHQDLHFINNGLFKCLHCSNEYTNKDHLLSHCTSVRNKAFLDETVDDKSTFEDDYISEEENKPIVTDLVDSIKIEAVAETSSKFPGSSENKNTNSKCTICYKEFSFASKHSESYLRKHMSRVHKSSTFPCKFCPATFDYLWYSKKHEKCHVLSDGTYKCFACNETYIYGAELRKHSKECKRDSLPISPFTDSSPIKSVSRSFPTKRRRIKIAFSRQGSSPYNCIYCRAKFTVKVDYQHHLRLHALQCSETSSMKCKHCNETFKWRKTLKNHVKSLHPELLEDQEFDILNPEHLMDPNSMALAADYHKCQLCSEGFTSALALTEHQSACHYPCRLCQHVYNSSSSMVEHQRKSHPGDLSSTNVTSADDQLLVKKEIFSNVVEEINDVPVVKTTATVTSPGVYTPTASITQQHQLILKRSDTSLSKPNSQISQSSDISTFSFDVIGKLDTIPQPRGQTVFLASFDLSPSENESTPMQTNDDSVNDKTNSMVIAKSQPDDESGEQTYKITGQSVSKSDENIIIEETTNQRPENKGEPDEKENLSIHTEKTLGVNSEENLPPFENFPTDDNDELPSILSSSN